MFADANCVRPNTIKSWIKVGLEERKRPIDD